MNIALARVANHLYDAAPRLYRALYSRYKAVSDRSERQLLRALVRPGMTVLDVGANIGVYTVYFAKLVGQAGQVVAFEPEQRNFERLQAAVGHLPQVLAVHAAVGQGSGTIKLFVADDLNVDHHTYAAEDGRRSVEVRCVSLDGFVPDRRIDLVKMDIQGAEGSALRGASRMLSTRPAPHLLMEYWPYGLRRAGEDPLDLLDLLRSAGYGWKTVGDEPLPSSAGDDPNQYVNLFASVADADTLMTAQRSNLSMWY